MIFVKETSRFVFALVLRPIYGSEFSTPDATMQFARHMPGHDLATGLRCATRWPQSCRPMHPKTAWVLIEEGGQ